MAVRVFVRQDSLTTTKNVSGIIGTSLLFHLHIVWTNFGIAFDSDGCISASWVLGVIQYIRHSLFHTMIICILLCLGYFISASRSDLATTVNALRNLGITCNGDIRLTTHQRRVAVCVDTLSCTEHVMADNGGTIGGT